MKRIIVVAVLVVLFVSGIDAGFADSQSEASVAFTEDSHPWSIAYRDYFLTRTARQGDLTLSIEESVYQPEQAEDLLLQVVEDMQVIASLLPVVDKTCTVYVVETLLHGAIEQTGDALYCTADDILSGAYRAELIEMMAEIPAYWKCAGLSGFLFGSSVDTAALRSYYEQAEDLDLLSLFPAYFLNVFASEEEMLVARNTAVSLTDTIISQYGMDTFLQTDRSEDRQDFLSSLGVGREYSDPYAETLAEYAYAFWEKEYPLVVTTDRSDTFYIRYGEGDLDSPAQVRAFLYEANVGVEAVLNGIANEAPEYLQTVLDNYNPVRVYYDPAVSSRISMCWVEIELGKSRHYFYEMMHILIQQPSNGRPVYDLESWKYQAIAQYLSIAFYQPTSMKKNYHSVIQEYLDLYSDPDNIADIEAKSLDEHYLHLAQEYLRSYGALPENWMDFDIGSYWKVAARVQMEEQLANDGAELEWAQSIGSLSYWKIRKTGGNELTYSQAYSLADYLIEAQGLSPFLQYCLEDTEFDEAFGLSYEEAKEAWLNTMEIQTEDSEDMAVSP